MKKDPKILICYNEPAKFYNNYIGKSFSSDDEDIDLSESEFSKNLEIITSSLKKNFQFVDTLPINLDITRAINYITGAKPDIIFNFVESVEGNSHYESYVAGLFDLLGVSYTGNNALTLGNCLVKSRTKQILHSYDVPTPKYFIAKYAKTILLDGFDLKYPVIAKLVHEDASIGISELSVIKSQSELKERLTFLFNTYSQDIIIEEYIEGRELNIAVLGGEILPISEITFDNLPPEYPKIITYEAKWSPESVYYKNTKPRCPAPLDENVKQKIESVALTAFKALGCRDYARVDIRLSKNNIPYVIEVNPNPDISIDSGFIRSTQAANITYDELLLKIANFAIKRMSNGKIVAE